jgi:DNA-binding IclR family transcriptional regulator
VPFLLYNVGNSIKGGALVLKRRRDKSVVAVAEKIIRILETFSLFRKGGLTLEEITREVRLAKSTVHRLLHSLQKLGVVEQNGEGGSYSLGARFFELSNNALPYQRLIAVSRPLMKSLMVTFGESVNLSVYEDGMATQIFVVESPKAHRVAATVGDRVPLHTSSMGKSLAAFLPPEELAKALEQHGLPRRTNNTIVTRAAFEAELERVRQTGVAHDNQEDAEGVECVSSAIFSSEGQVVGAISISGPSVRMSKQLPAVGHAIHECASRISWLLGYKAPPPAPSSSSAIIGRETTEPRWSERIPAVAKRANGTHSDS